MNTVRLHTPLTEESIKGLQKGDCVLLSGTIYTARDAAHKRMAESFLSTGVLPLCGKVIYYAGPCPKRPGEVIGSVGPTTSYRMDDYAELFCKNGCPYSIGKGKRDDRAIKAIRASHGVHFDAIGGAGAYYKSCVKSAKAVLYPDLGAEAVYELEVVDFPVVVHII
ncbi:MAG: fumarate hydratase C-terminal domain-containing protein [Clostridia bacterium]|nr:fumarate hydratase C-terminal domain-containing protein [Clostridia bacterium]